MSDKNTLYLECRSGISGDMTVAALLDLGATEENLRRTLAKLPVGGYEIKVQRLIKNGLEVCDFDVILEEETEPVSYTHLLKSPEGMKFAGSKVTRYTDYKDGVDGIPASNVLQLWMEDGSQAQIRPSGTEPKIKVYTERVMG